MQIRRLGSDEIESDPDFSIEVTPYGNRNFAVYLNGQLLAVTVYRKGAVSIATLLLQLRERIRALECSGAPRSHAPLPDQPIDPRPFSRPGVPLSLPIVPVMEG